MIREKNAKAGFRRRVFGFFFVVLVIFGLIGGPWITHQSAYAVPDENGNSQSNTDNENNENNDRDGTDDDADNGNNQNNQGGNEQNSDNNGAGTEGNNGTNNSGTGNNGANNNGASGGQNSKESKKDGCKNAFGPVAWLTCSGINVASKAVDWLYDKIEEILVIDPISMEGTSPIYEIWKYFRGMTNIVFIVFLLVVIYSQITGMGISNYGIKKTLPKLIVAAVLVNLSFMVCTLAVDLSNIIGNSLRGLFTSVEEAVVAGMGDNAEYLKNMRLALSDLYANLAGAAGVAMVALPFVAHEAWMLALVVFGGIVSVVVGLVTISLRQAVVALLIMISPLAVVAYMLPNTDKWFKKWRDLFFRMLVFYPMFSLLFGASSLAGFALIASAKDGFGLMLGAAVQIFPLFFAWKLMKMSGTPLNAIHARLHRLSAMPMAKMGRWAMSHRQATKHRLRAAEHSSMPTTRLNQYLFKRRFSRDMGTNELRELEKNMGFDYHARRRYDTDGTPSKRGMEAYDRQARNMEYFETIERDKNNMNKGLGQLAATKASADEVKIAKLEKLDARNMNASDFLKAERARGAKIEYENAEGYHNRMENAMNAHMDYVHGYKRNPNTGEYELDSNGNRIRRDDYRFHEMTGGDTLNTAAMRYGRLLNTMEGSETDVQNAAADAAINYNSQRKLLESRHDIYRQLTPPTKDDMYRLEELTKRKDAAKHIDEIIPGLRVLNQRGDTDLVAEQIMNVLNSEEGVKLGTHASQAISSFLMFEMKDTDPFLRRYGKYINLETARAYNKNKRQNLRLSLDEYLLGEYEDWDKNDPSARFIDKPKRSVVELMEGTPVDKIERTAYGSFDNMLINACRGEDGNIDVKKYLARRKEVQGSINSAFISASKKYATGSEPMVNAVKFWTGYGANGVARWEDPEDPLYGSEEAKKYFRELTLDNYIRKLTASEVLGLRSDYKTPLGNHLADAYEDAETDDWEDVDRKEHDELSQKMAEIQTRYGNLSADEAEQRRAADRKNVRREMAGAEIRRILRSEGTLGQVFNMRKNSSASNAKKFVRDWLLLDDETRVSHEMKRIKNESKQKKNESVAPDGDSTVDGEDGGEAIHNNARQTVEDVYRRYRGGASADVEEFWNEVKDSISDPLEMGDNSVDVEEIQRQLSGYTDVTTLYNEIIDKFFGGH